MIRAVAVEYGGLGQQIEQLVAALFILLDYLYMYSCLYQLACKVIGYSAAAYHHHVPHLALEGTHGPEKAAYLGRGSEYGKLIAAAYDEIALGYENLLASAGGADQYLYLKLPVKVRKLYAVQRAVLLYLELHKVYPALCKGLSLNSGYKAHKAGYLGRCGLFGIYHH